MASIMDGAVSPLGPLNLQRKLPLNTHRPIPYHIEGKQWTTLSFIFLPLVMFLLPIDKARTTQLFSRATTATSTESFFVRITMNDDD